jgi:hypothetical protein
MTGKFESLQTYMLKEEKQRVCLSRLIFSATHIEFHFEKLKNSNIMLNPTSFSNLITIFV